MVKLKDKKASDFLNGSGINLSSSQAIKKLALLGVKDPEKVYWAWRRKYMDRIPEDILLPDPKPKVSEEEREKILNSYEKGKSMMEISKKLGVRYSVVNGTVRRAKEQA